MEIIINENNKQIELRYTPTIKDNSLNWFQIEANKSTSNNTSIWNSSLWFNKGVNGVYNAITPLTIANYASVEQSKQEPILLKMIQTANGEERNIMYIIGNRQLKCMQENGTIQNIFIAPISTYNKKGLCGKRTQNLYSLLTATYTDAHGNARYYWQDYGKFTIRGFAWSLKALLNEFYIKVDNNLPDINIYTPTKDFPQTNNNTSVHRIIFTRSYSNYWTLTNTFEVTTPNNINNILNITNSYSWFFNGNTGQPDQRVEMTSICLGYNVKLIFPNNDNICLLRAGKNYYDAFTIDDYIGGYGVVTEEDENGHITKKIQGTPLQGREIEIKSTDYFIAIDIYTLHQLLRYSGDISTFTPEYASYYNRIGNNTPFVNNKQIYYYLPQLDLLQLFRIYQYCLNTEITIDEYNTMQTSIIPIDTTLKYFPIISYTQKFDTFGAIKAKRNYIKISAGENTEEKQILDINLSNANILDIEAEADLVTLPSEEYFAEPATHTAKSFTRCFEVVISINYADFKNNLTYISFFGQKARVLSGQWSEDNTAKLIVLL